MRAIAAALLALTGCTQIFGLGEPMRIASDAAAVLDGADDAPTEVEIDAVSVKGDCDPSLTSLIVCFDFENNATDLSAIANSATASGVAFSAGHLGQAINVSEASSVTQVGVAAYNVTAVTIEAWVRLTSFPAGRAGVFDSDARYGLFVYGDGSIALRMTQSPAGGVSLNQWHHVAATDDGVTRQLYVDGVVVVAVASTPVPMSAQGNEIGGNAPSGERLIGAIDSLRVYNVVRTPAQIAASAMN